MVLFDLSAIILYLPCFVVSLLVPLSLSFVPIAYVVGVKKGAVQGGGGGGGGGTEKGRVHR